MHSLRAAIFLELALAKWGRVGCMVGGDTFAEPHKVDRWRLGHGARSPKARGRHKTGKARSRRARMWPRLGANLNRLMRRSRILRSPTRRPNLLGCRLHGRTTAQLCRAESGTTLERPNYRTAGRNARPPRKISDGAGRGMLPMSEADSRASWAGLHVGQDFKRPPRSGLRVRMRLQGLP